MFTLWTFHGYFPESLVRIYVAELAMVLGKYSLWTFHGYFPESLVRIYVADLAMVLGELIFHSPEP